MLFNSTCVIKILRRFVSNRMEYKEIKIPVPWGEIAGKWWGSQKQKPVLTLHGWQVGV